MSELSETEMQYQRDLALAGLFTLEELAENREGRMSVRQRSGMKNKFLLFVIPLGVIGLMLTLAGLKEIDEDLSKLIGGLVMLALAAVLVIKMRKSSREGFAAECKEGKIEKFMVESSIGGNTDYYIRVEGYSFKVTRGVYEVTNESQPHRVYHAKSGDLRFLSIEVLPRS